ncbi:hypothetical protein EON66_08740 [archaeon]|nr:MAG: hypothetical protein EON66_08740 [archaeon]
MIAHNYCTVCIAAYCPGELTLPGKSTRQVCALSSVDDRGQWHVCLDFTAWGAVRHFPYETYMSSMVQVHDHFIYKDVL